MTLLEQIAQESANQTLYTALNATIEATAREIAREILADPAFRADLKRFTQQSISRAMRDLRAPAKRSRKKATRRR